MCSNQKTLSHNQAVRLLVVDDESHIRVPITRALSALGYLVSQAGSGREALEHLKQTNFDLMLLDIQMPNLDGVQVMQRARQLNSKMLIVILTGHPTLDNAITSIKMDVADYLCKPASISSIAETVATVLEKNSKQMQRERLMHMMAEALHTLKEIEDNASDLPTEIPDHITHVSPLVLDLEKLQVVREDEPDIIELTKGEASVLATLMSAPNQIFSCRKLVKLIFEYDTDEYNAKSVIRPYIFRLRRKIEANPSDPRLIQTIRSRGYTYTGAAIDLSAAA